MSDLQAIIHELDRRSDELGIDWKQPLDLLDLQKWSEQVSLTFNFGVPSDYLAFLAISDGLLTQRGWLYDTKSFLEQNYIYWFCETRGRIESDSYAIEYVSLPTPPTIAYACLGAYGNLDRYIFDFASEEYRAITLGDANEILFSCLSLGELLVYMAEIEIA